MLHFDIRISNIEFGLESGKGPQPFISSMWMLTSMCNLECCICLMVPSGPVLRLEGADLTGLQLLCATEVPMQHLWLRLPVVP